MKISISIITASVQIFLARRLPIKNARMGMGFCANYFDAPSTPFTHTSIHHAPQLKQLVAFSMFPPIFCDPYKVQDNDSSNSSMEVKKTSGPAHRTDSGDDSPVRMKDQSPPDSPIHSKTLFVGDIETSLEAAPSPKAASSTTHNSAALTTEHDDDTVVQENEDKDEDFSDSAAPKDIRFLKVVLVAVFLLVLVAGGLLTYFFTRTKTTQQQLNDLGFPYRKDMANGWLFDANTATAGKSYKRYDGAKLKEATEVGCAKKCASKGAFAGAWNTFYQECWCYLETPNANFCFERCVIEEGVEFSSTLLQSSFDWCPKSYCEIFDAKAYCDYRPMKDVADCRNF